jgi:putative tryptophan/tyrosine transport system substrate-binding protein
MRRRDFFVLVGIATAARVLDANALESGKLYKIGILTAGGPGPLTPLRDMLREDLRELGLIEGKNLAFEGRYAENDLDRLPALAAELVSREVDLIIGMGTLAPLAAKRATVTIPIVMAAAGDPVGSGLIASLARPGGNVTGTSLMAPDLGGKRLELVKELLPEISRVAVLWNAANPYSALVFKATVGAAWTLAIEVQSLEVRVSDIAFAAGFRSVRRFNDAFRATYGRPPSSFRRSVRPNCSPDLTLAPYEKALVSGEGPLKREPNRSQVRMH